MDMAFASSDPERVDTKLVSLVDLNGVVMQHHHHNGLPNTRGAHLQPKSRG